MIHVEPRFNHNPLHLDQPLEISVPVVKPLLLVAFASVLVFTLASGLTAIEAPAQMPQGKSTPPAATAPTAVPALIPYAATVEPSEGNKGKPLSSELSITFLLFKDETGGEALWGESQLVVPDQHGNYQVHLGASSANGFPLELFASGEARWLEVQTAGEPTPRRTLLATVPYAAKAADATTLGGLPASAYALAGTQIAAPAATTNSATPDITSNATPLATATTVTTVGGTTGDLARFSSGHTIVNSILTDSGTGIGVGKVATPGSALDVNGGTVFRGNLDVSRAGNATTSTGYPSNILQFQATTVNSSNGAVQYPTFVMKSEPTNNNTSSPGGTLNVLYSLTGAPVETGFSIQANGQTIISALPINTGLAQLAVASPNQSALNAVNGYGGSGSGNDTGYSGIGGYFQGGTIVNTIGGSSGSGGSGVQGLGGGYEDALYGGDGGSFFGGTGSQAGGAGIYADGGYSSDSSSTYYAGVFNGDIDVSGTSYATSNLSAIDNPTDPTNKYLVHSSVQSSEQVDIYSGNVTTDELGNAIVTLPAWFEPLNSDFRYQLTTIGRNAHAWVAEEVSKGRFRISTDAQHVKVSWQITGVRQDAYSKANPLTVEPIKPAAQRGLYLHPEAYHQPMSKQGNWANHPRPAQPRPALTTATR